MMTQSAAAVHDAGPGRIAVEISTGGQTFPGDEPIAAGGGAPGPRPYDLLCAALAECSTLTLRLYADRKAWPLEAIHVAVDHAKETGQTPPDVFHRYIRLEGDL